MAKLKQAVIPYIELIQYSNTTNKLPYCFKRYADMNPNLLSEQDHQMILDTIKAREIWIMMNIRKMKMTTIYIVMILMMMIINKSYFIFNLLWKTSGGTALIAYNIPNFLISSVSLPRHIYFRQSCVSGNATSKLESNIHLTQTVIQWQVWYHVCSNKHMLGIQVRNPMLCGSLRGVLTKNPHMLKW